MKNHAKTTYHITQHEEVFQIAGIINFTNVMALYRESVNWFNQYDKLTFDFSASQTNNSVLIALIIEWIKLAEGFNKTFTLNNLPSTFRVVIESAGLESLINPWLLK